MDERDSAILKELLKDSRQSTAVIARKTGIPRVTVHERIQRFRKNGVIRRFTVEPDYALLGRPISAFILIAFSPSVGSNQRKLASEIASLDGVSEVSVLAGEWDLVVKARAESLKELGKFVVDRLRKLNGVGRTVTMPVLS